MGELQISDLRFHMRGRIADFRSQISYAEEDCRFQISFAVRMGGFGCLRFEI